MSTVLRFGEYLPNSSHIFSMNGVVDGNILLKKENNIGRKFIGHVWSKTWSTEPKVNFQNSYAFLFLLLLFSTFLMPFISHSHFVQVFCMRGITMKERT